MDRSKTNTTLWPVSGSFGDRWVAGLWGKSLTPLKLHLVYFVWKDRLSGPLCKQSEARLLCTRFSSRIGQCDNMVAGRDHRLALRFLSG